MSDQLERLLSANKELQDNMEVLQTELGRKQTEFEKLLDERYFRSRRNSSFKAWESYCFSGRGGLTVRAEAL